MEHENLTPQQRENLWQLKNYRPMDDDFMRELFRNRWNLTEEVLRIITGIKDLILIQQETQYDLERLIGARSICLDVLGRDNQGRIYDMEVQRADNGAEPERARYHSSAMDIEFLSKKQDFDELPITYTIFITENDIFSSGLPVYRIERTIVNDSHRPFYDNAHILYVNGAYQCDDEIGRLMHDFRCTNADDMYLESLANATRYYKEYPEGVSYMCKMMDERLEKAEHARSVENALEMLADGALSLEKIAQYSKLPLEEVIELDKQRKSAKNTFMY